MTLLAVTVVFADVRYFWPILPTPSLRVKSLHPIGVNPHEIMVFRIASQNQTYADPIWPLGGVGIIGGKPLECGKSMQYTASASITRN